MPTNKLRIAFIGFGELGRRFTRDLAGRSDVTLSAYDILLDDPVKRPAFESAAQERNVDLRASHAAAIADAAIVISAVTADQVRAVAKTAAGHLKAGQLFLDVNSASPATKKAAAKIVEGSGAVYVEGAVMAAVAGPGIRVEILTGGPEAERATALLNAVGMNLTPVAREHGKASAIKLCRSIMIKGLEALMVDSARACKHWGVEAEVYASLTRTFPSIDWPKLAGDMAERVATHGVRRSAEMREAAEMLTEIGLAPDLARAVADAQLRGAKKKA